MFGDPATNMNNWGLTEFVEVVSREKYSLQRGPFGGAIKKQCFVEDGYKVYEQKNAIRDDFEIGTYFLDENKYKEMENFSVVADDLIVSCSGTIGKVAIAPSNARLGIINQALLKIRLDKNKALPLFFKYLLETDHLQRMIFGGSAGSAIKNVKPLQQIKKTVFPLPPLPRQRRFAEHVAEYRKLETGQATSRRRLDDLFQSVLYQAYKGKI
jgi:type I restriction enzyme S subunit